MRSQIQHPASSLQHPPGPWPALESSRGLISVPACWRSRLGEDYEPFRAAFLTKSARPAKFYPCPRGCGCMHEIVKTPSSKHESVQTSLSDLELGAWSLDVDTASPFFLAVCRCEHAHCPDIPLTAADAILLELSWTKLARAVCQAFNLDSKPLDLGLLNTRQIGSWSAAAVPVILTIQTDGAWFRGVVLELIARLRGRFILLAPTSAHYDAISHELIENANAGFFPLEGNLQLLPSGLLQATKIPGELFARFTPDPKSEPGEDVARHAFALVEQLESGGKAPTPLAVFRLYCVEGLSAGKIARRLRCSKPTILRRLKLIEQRVGVAPEKLRCYSEHLENVGEEAGRHGARRVYRNSLL